MRTRIKNARFILPDGICENTYLYYNDGVIESITAEELAFDAEIDAEGLFVSPGFIDLHVHGGGGFRLVDGTLEAISSIANIHAKHGTTTMYPTLSSFDYETIIKLLDAVDKYKDDEKVLPNIYGVHLEGPYCSTKQSGAQDVKNYRDPDKNEYAKIIEKHGDLIKRWSYAPENEGAVEFQKYLSEHNIIGSIAHSDACYDEIMKCYENGLKMVTHLYSCTSTITRVGGFRRLGVIETAYLYDDFYVEAIADGCHLPPELLRLIYKIKGEDRMCLVTDATRYGGVTDFSEVKNGSAELTFIIEDGVAKLPDRSAFAGSIATTDRLLRTCVKDAGIPLESCVKMLTATPAKVMGLDKKGLLKPGYDADIVFFDDDICVKDVIICGKRI